MSTNLWPEFEVGRDARSPKSIIEELGGGLKERTQGLVLFYSGPTKIRGDEVSLLFSLYSPSLRYQYPFLQVSFPLKDNYPVTLVTDRMDDITANNEEELKSALSKIFSASTTVETVQKLLSLASNTTPQAPF